MSAPQVLAQWRTRIAAAVTAEVTHRPAWKTLDLDGDSDKRIVDDLVVKWLRDAGIDQGPDIIPAYRGDLPWHSTPERPRKRFWFEGMAGVDPNEDVAFGDRLGECYPNAFQYALHNPGSTLIHGSIQGFGNPRIGHAWVVDADGEVFEPTQGKHFESEQIWNAFAKAEIYHRYDKTEFATQALITKHYGPWHDTEGEHGLPMGRPRTPTLRFAPKAASA